MGNENHPVFFVNPQSDPLLLKIVGRASYLNSAPLSEFFNNCIQTGKLHFIIDFQECASMDSTFLGLLASVAMHALEHIPQGSITLQNISQRNLELVKNLGLHKILKINDSPILPSTDNAEAISLCPDPKFANPDMIL